MSNQNPDRDAFIRKFSLKEAGQILNKEGFQTEKISTVSWFPEPILFEYENEVVLLGSRHFDGETLFLESKRFFTGVNKDVIDDAIRRVSEENPCIAVIRWDDGSLSFRSEMDENVDENNFIEKLFSILSLLKAFVNRVEDQDGVGCEPWSISTLQRHFFIYETLDMSLILSKINV